MIEKTLAEYDGKWAAHNGLGFDKHVARATGYSFNCRQYDDTLMMSKVIDSSRQSHGLKQLGEMYLGKEATDPTRQLDEAIERYGYTNKGNVLAQLDTDSDAYLFYAAGDTVLVANLIDYMNKEIEPYRRSYEAELGAWWVVSDMEERGVYVDEKWALEMKAEFQQNIAKLVNQIAGFGISKPQSAMQRIKVLQEEGWIPEEWTDSGRPKLDKRILGTLDYDVVPLLLQHARATKWLSSYIEPVLQNQNGQLFPKYNAFGAITGRQSVSNPPIQQIPSHDPDAWRMRRMFLAPPGQVLYGIDYQAQENRLLAHFSKDPLLTEYIQTGADMHRYAASRIFQIPEDEVTKAQRDVSKTVVYARQYGGGTKKISRILGIDQESARAAIERLDSAYERVKEWKTEIEDLGQHRFYSEGVAYTDTWLGRRVNINVPKGAYKPKYYTLVNMKIQGTGADMLTVTLNRLAAAGLDKYLYMTIHDELQLAVPPGPEGEEIAQEAARLMDVSEALGFPLPVEISGPNEHWTK